MVSKEINFAILKYNELNYDPDSVFQDKISNQGELFSEYELKSGEFKALFDNDNILSSKDSEENNINNGIQEKKESKEENKKNVHFITTEYNYRGKAKKSFTKNKRKKPPLSSDIIII